jgi:hypothetical protein
MLELEALRATEGGAFTAIEGSIRLLSGAAP